MTRLDRKKDRESLPKDGSIVYEPVRHRRGLSMGYRASTGSWFARAFAHGKNHYENIGNETDLNYDEALEKAEPWFKRVRGDAPIGYDVLNAIEDYAATKAELADRDERALALLEGDLRVLTKHVTGELLSTRIDDVKTGVLEDWLKKIKRKGGSKRRVFTVLAAALSNAHRLGRGGDPKEWRNVEHVRVKKQERSRLFIPTEKELADLLAKVEPDFGALVRAAVLTGCRYGELCGALVEDFDADKGELHIRRSKTGERTMLLSSAAVALFRQQVKGKTSRAPIFSAADGQPWKASMQHRRMRDATPIRAFVFYSLRHLALSRQLAAGIPSALVAKNAGTSELILRQHYHKFLGEQDRSIFDRVALAA